MTIVIILSWLLSVLYIWSGLFFICEIKDYFKLFNDEIDFEDKALISLLWALWPIHMIFLWRKKEK